MPLIPSPGHYSGPERRRRGSLQLGDGRGVRLVRAVPLQALGERLDVDDGGSFGGGRWGRGHDAWWESIRMEVWFLQHALPLNLNHWRGSMLRRRRRRGGTQTVWLLDTDPPVREPDFSIRVESFVPWRGHRAICDVILDSSINYSLL